MTASNTYRAHILMTAKAAAKDAQTALRDLHMATQGPFKTNETIRQLLADMGSITTRLETITSNDI